MPKINRDEIPVRVGGLYPGALGEIVSKRKKQALGDAGGLTQFGVNLTVLPPGSASAHRHWHANEDECVLIIAGNVALIEDDGETELTPGDAAAFPAGRAVGHMLLNRSDTEVIVLEIGSRANEEEVFYTDPDVDMKLTRKDAQWNITHKDGTSY